MNEAHNDIAIQHAKEAGLRYVYDSDPGIKRRRHGKGFTYIGPDSTRLPKDALQRIKTLAVPPAWKDVWICTLPHGHLQATGFDERARKQYRYHEKWRQVRDASKFESMIVFGRSLPLIRRKVLESLNLDDLPKDKVVAAVIRLLDKTGLRVGNDEYAETNNSYGLTTLRKKHVDAGDREIALDFPGKGGKVWSGSFNDPKAAKVIKACEELPGYRLFQYVDKNGERHAITSGDVNDCLFRWTGASITAKDFRTWHACALFLEEAMKLGGCEKGVKLQIKPVLKTVSAALGNTPAILQKSYVHPQLIDLYRTGCLMGKEWERGNLQIAAGLRETEGLLLRWLEKSHG